MFCVLIMTDNPAKVPLRLVIVRSLPGLGLYLLAWLGFSYLIFSLILYSLSLRDRLPPGLALASLACTVGLAVPLLIRGAKNNLLRVTSNKLVQLLIIALQVFDEATALYFGKLINREERRADSKVFKDRQEAAERAVSRLFEFHIVDIARDVALRRPNAPEEQILGPLKTRDEHVKFKRLMRTLGYEDCLSEIEDVIVSPQKYFPNWPPDKGDRRKVSDRRRTLQPCDVERRHMENVRRKVNKPCVRDYILGHIDHLKLED
jgi:hypothetical protein